MAILPLVVIVSITSQVKMILRQSNQLAHHTLPYVATKRKIKPNTRTDKSPTVTPAFTRSAEGKVQLLHPRRNHGIEDSPHSINLTMRAYIYDEVPCVSHRSTLVLQLTKR